MVFHNNHPLISSCNNQILNSTLSIHKVFQRRATYFYLTLYYVDKYTLRFTGNADLDRVLTILLGNPNFFGALLACVLDNTIPGNIRDNNNKISDVPKRSAGS